MPDPKFTVVIPTRERHDVLEKALQTVLAQDYERLEILVSDNASSPETADVVRSVNDARIRYVNTGRRLSMSHNWEFALSHIDEGWVTIIGDDDGLLPGAVRAIADVAARTQVKMIRTAVCAYTWPSLHGQEHGRLVVPLRRGAEIRKSRAWLAKVLRGDATYHDLPMLYNGGYVEVGVLKDLARRTGAIIRSRIPDVYSAVAIASVLDEYAYLDEPSAINGASKHSTGSAQFAKHGDRAAAKRFDSEGNIAWHDALPLGADDNIPMSVDAFVYESYLQSADLRTDAPDGGISHAQQLALILAGASGRSRAVLEEWGRLFAAKHGLPFDSLRVEARDRRRRRRFNRLLSRWSRSLNGWDINSPAEPVRDVQEAAVVAAAVLRRRPSRLRNALRRMGQRAQRAGGGARDRRAGVEALETTAREPPPRSR
jgi:glycosyltransferase involved in cell wall biosynthesis